jgi:glucose dehydrogenase
VPLVVTKSLLLVPDGSSVIWDTAGYNGPAKLSAYDKRTGAMIGQVPMPAGATTAPVSYPTKAGQRIVVAVSSTALGASWVAYGLE